MHWLNALTRQRAEENLRDAVQEATAALGWQTTLNIVKEEIENAQDDRATL